MHVFEDVPQPADSSVQRWNVRVRSGAVAERDDDRVVGEGILGIVGVEDSTVERGHTEIEIAVNVWLSGPQVSALKHAPPPWKNSITLVGLAGRSQISPTRRP